MGDRMACRRAFDVRRDDANFAVFTGDVGKHPNTWAVNAVIVQDENPHRYVCVQRPGRLTSPESRKFSMDRLET